MKIPSGSVSYSQLTTFLTCRYQWQLAYVHGLSRVMGDEPLELGSAIHAGLAAFFAGETTLSGIHKWADAIIPGWYDVYVNEYGSVADPDEIPVFGSIIISLAQIVDKAHRICKRVRADVENKWDVVSVQGTPLIEMELSTRIKRGVDFRGVIDLVVRERATGYVFLVDFKSRQKLVADPMHDFDTQQAMYQYLLYKCLGLTTHGSIIYQIRTEIPREPKLNKDGNSMSRSEIATDWPTYEAALKKAGLNPADYGDMYERLIDKKFTSEYRTFRPLEQLVRIWENTALHVKEMEQTRVFPRNISNRTCGGCQVREFCMSTFEGQPTDWMMGALYKLRTEDDTDFAATPDTVR